MTPPAPTGPGPRDPTRTRRAHEAVLAAVIAGELTVDDVLDLVDHDDTTGRITVTRLLTALPGVSPDQVDPLLARLDLTPSRRLGSLHALERVDLRSLPTGG